MKFLIAVTPNGAVSFLSKCWGGKVPDNNITHQSGFLEKREHGDIILADRDFDIGDDLGVYGARLEIHSYAKGKKQLSLQEVEYLKGLSKVPIHIERITALLKNKFTLLYSTLQITMVKHMSDTDFANIDKILTDCAALVN